MSSYLVLLLILFAIFAFWTRESNFAAPSQFLSNFSSWLWATLSGQYPGGYRGSGAGENDRSRSFYSAQGSQNDASRLSRQSNPYGQVRDRVFAQSPDPNRNGGAAYSRFQQSRGSVVSPQSMYRPLGNESMYKDSGY